MNAITIFDNGNISIDGRDTGLGVKQTGEGTVLFRREISGRQDYEAISLPHACYSLAHPNPASGNPGRQQFEADLRAVLGGSLTSRRRLGTGVMTDLHDIRDHSIPASTPEQIYHSTSRHGLRDPIKVSDLVTLDELIEANDHGGIDAMFALISDRRRRKEKSDEG